MNEEANILIDRISKISKTMKTEIKPLVQKLSQNIAKNIDHPEIKVMAKTWVLMNQSQNMLPGS